MDPFWMDEGDFLHPRGWSGMDAHPRSPAGSGGPGAFGSARPAGLDHGEPVHTGWFEWHLWGRARSIYHCVHLALERLPAVLLHETGYTLHELGEGLWQGLMLGLAIVATTTSTLR